MDILGSASGAAVLTAFIIFLTNVLVWWILITISFYTPYVPLF
jgi:hypothetical protein